MMRSPLLILLIVAGCAERVEPLGRETAESVAAETALANLDASIAAREELLASRPLDLELTASLVELLLTRVGFVATYDDFDRVLALSTEALERSPQASEALVLHGRVLTALHRFEEAEGALDEAERLGADVVTLRDSIALARGESLGQVLERRQALVERSQSYGNLTQLAAAYAARAAYDEADEAFASAIAAYRDVSPLPGAWVAFQRGVMWSEQAGDDARGLELYRDAVALLPRYVVGSIHLAELEVASGEVDAAVSRLERLRPSPEPEVTSRLASFLAERDLARSRSLADETTRRYDALLARHRAAFLDHAAEFFMDAGGDPARALGLALENLANRPTPRAYDLAIRAALTASDATRACQLGALAVALPFPTQPLVETLVEVDALCR